MIPQTLQTLSQVAIVVGIVLTGLGGFGAYFYGKLIDDQREGEAQVREDTLRADIGRLLQGNDALQRRLEPFESLAHELHPTLKSDEALNKLRDDLKAVEQRASVLERQAAPRALSPQQQEVIVSMLRTTPARSVDVVAVMGDAEALELARQLKSVLEAAGWKVDGVAQAVFSNATRGIVISVGREPPPAAANEFFQALQRAGIAVSGNLDPNKRDDGVSVWVGSK